jgi:DNA-binding IclR family transcriptional regulator
MARKPNNERMEAIYATVRSYPGERPGFIARLLGIHRSEVTRLLPSLDRHGFLLSEDERGGLWPFKRNP